MAEALPAIHLPITSNNCHPYSTYLNLSSEALTVAGSPAPRHAPSTTHQGSMVPLHPRPSLTGVGGYRSHCTSRPAAQGWAATGLTAPPAQLHRGGRLQVSLHTQPSFTEVGGCLSHCTLSPASQGWAVTGLTAPQAQLHRDGWLLVSLHPQPSCTGEDG
jgi:hypothetical protein